MAAASRRESTTQYGTKLPHWYNKEDPEHIRTIFCELEGLCDLRVDPSSRMIRQFVGSVFRRGVISFDPLVDFSILTICKDRTQGKEQDDFEHESTMALVTWDEKEALPCNVEIIDSEPTVRYSFGRTISAHPPIHPGSFVSSSGGERERSESPASVASPDAPSTPSNVGTSTSTTPRDHTATTMKMMTKWYPELLCLPKYPRAKERDVDYPPGTIVSSARNKKRFVVHFRDSSEPSRVTYTYAAGMPAHSGEDLAAVGSSNGAVVGGSPGIGMSPPSGPDDLVDVVMFPKFTLPGGVTSTSTQERSPWGPRPEEDEEDDDDDDSSDGEGGGPPDVQWEEDDEWN